MIKKIWLKLLVAKKEQQQEKMKKHVRKKIDYFVIIAYFKNIALSVNRYVSSKNATKNISKCFPRIITLKRLRRAVCKL